MNKTILTIIPMMIFAISANADISSCNSTKTCLELAKTQSKDYNNAEARSAYKRACDLSDDDKMNACAMSGDYLDSIGKIKEARITYSNSCTKGNHYSCKKVKDMKEKIRVLRVNRRMGTSI